MNVTRRLSLTAIAAAVAAAAFGAAYASGAIPRHPASGTTQSIGRASAAPVGLSSPAQHAVTATHGPIALAAAEAIAARVAGGRVVKAKLDDESVGTQIDLTVMRAGGVEVDVTIDAAGRVLGQHVDVRQTAEPDQPAGDSPDHTG